MVIAANYPVIAGKHGLLGSPGLRRHQRLRRRTRQVRSALRLGRSDIAKGRGSEVALLL